MRSVGCAGYKAADAKLAAEGRSSMSAAGNAARTLHPPPSPDVLCTSSSRKFLLRPKQIWQCSWGREISMVRSWCLRRVGRVEGAARTRRADGEQGMQSGLPQDAATGPILRGAWQAHDDLQGVRQNKEKQVARCCAAAAGEAQAHPWHASGERCLLPSWLREHSAQHQMQTLKTNCTQSL